MRGMSSINAPTAESTELTGHGYRQSDCLVQHLPESACDPTNFDCICADVTLMDNVGTCSLGACTVLEELGK